jgi:hypothetical protein
MKFRPYDKKSEQAESSVTTTLITVCLFVDCVNDLSSYWEVTHWFELLVYFSMPPHIW